MAMVCFDSHVIIWGIKRQASSTQQEMIERAEALIKQCEENKDTVVVPALVVGEVLCNLPLENQPQLFKVLNENFMIVPYDMRAARHNAKIWQEQELLRQELRKADVPRQAIKADIAILSTALAYSCETLYSGDKDLIKLAQKYIRVKGVADVAIPPQQPPLLKDS
jgi:predicted nucleic acid-binding protein